uniref:Ribosomal RNA small subunit methyltransferase E n=1 Tax=Geobacter metallireducens TaxID=28232 RepID=A0A831UCQ6_GEOME
MSGRRFMAPDADLSGGTVRIGGDLFRHMARVLRLKIDTPVMLADGRGAECAGIIREIGRDHLTVAVVERRAAARDGGAPRITLIQGLPKGEKMELILQKGTELGVNEVVPFLADRSVSRVPADRQEERLRRWQRIAAEAARQAGRPDIPALRLAGGMAEAVRDARHDLKLLLWEEERATTLKGAMADRTRPASIAVIVGPEGGLTAAEAETAREAGFIPVTLGRRILRTETAGIALLAILQYLHGDLGGDSPGHGGSGSPPTP